MSKLKKLIVLPIIMVILMPIMLQVISVAAATTVWKDTETGIEFDITINDDGTTSVSPKNITPGQANLALVEAQKRAESMAKQIAGLMENTSSDRTIETKENTTTIAPDLGLDHSRLNNITVASIGGTVFCLAEDIRISQGSNSLEKDIAHFSNGNIQMPLDPAKGYSITVDKLYTGNNVTTETVSKYKVTGQKTLGETSETAKAAYLYSHYTEHDGWQSDVQAGIWYTSEAVQRQDIENPIEREATAYEMFVKDYETHIASGKKIITDTVIDEEVSTQVVSGIQWLGQYSIDYVRGAAKVDGREKVEFGGITNAVLLDQNGNEINKDAWEFVPVVTITAGKENNERPEWDKDYEYPYPNEPFYIKLYTDKLDGVTKVSAIKYTYDRLDIRSNVDYLEGTYDKIWWEGKPETKTCFGAFCIPQYDPISGTSYQQMLAPGECGCTRQGAHRYTVGYKVVESDRKTMTSQPLSDYKGGTSNIISTIITVPTSTNYRINIPNIWPIWPYWPDYPDDDKPEGDLTFTIAGFVWEDEKTGKESNYDGQMGASNSEEPESGIKNVEVKLYRHGTDYAIKSTYTDANGAYVFNEVPVGTYDVGFIYDGMTYTTTKAFASGSASDYENDPNDEKYILNSKAEELPKERQEFNNKFEVINQYGSNGVAKEQDKIWYETANGKSVLQTTDSNGMVKEVFQLETRTSNTLSVGYPFTDNVSNSTKKTTIGGQQYYENYKYMAYVNLGLKKREPVDFALTKDVSTATLTINGKESIYKYNVRNEDTFDIEYKNSVSYKDISYDREVYNTDYTYRIDTYDGDLGTVSKAEIMGLKSEDQELKVFVTYKVKIANQSVLYSGTINELVDYYDKKYTLIEQDKKLDIRNDDGTWYRDKIVAEAPYYETKSGKKGDLTITKGKDYNNSKYERVYFSGIEEEILQSGDYIYLYITFEVDKQDVTRNIEKGDKNNLIEISSYSTYDAFAAVKSNTVGMIDRDSQPGNLDPEYDSTMEDDSDKAPAINIKLAEEKPRVIYGTVWEDERDAGKIKSNQYSTGNGVRDGGEKGVDGVIVQLVEIINDINGNKVGEYIWQEMLSGGTAYSYMNISGTLLDGDYGQAKTEKVNGMEQGEYYFEGYVPGDYIVRFIYGSDERTINPNYNNGKSYNGQDYKSTVYLLGEDVDREWYDVRSTYLNGNLLSDARDREDVRLDVIDYSKQINFKIAEVLASADSTKKTALWNELAEETQMVAETAKMRVEVEYQSNTTDGQANTTYTIPNVDFGLVARPKADLELNKEIEWIKITLADGSTLIDTEAGLKRNVNWVSNKISGNSFRKGAIHIYMDEEVMQGANIQIKYKITITNNSEIDYTGYGSVGSAYYTGVKGSDDHVVTTSIDYVADYLDNAIAYREQENATHGWKTIGDIDKLQSIDNMSGRYLDGSIIETIKQNVNQILVNDSKTNIELRPDEKVEYQLILTKTLTSSGDEDPAFDNIAEILQYSNEVGRRSELPGDQDPTKTPTVGYNDSDCAETITITPPTGENRAHYYVLATAVLAILLTGIVLIKKKVLDK